jgi:hypothetical protein
VGLAVLLREGLQNANCISWTVGYERVMWILLQLASHEQSEMQWLKEGI